MHLGLCMLVRDEASNIGPCLRPILDLFDDVAIVLDDRSEDRTAAILREEFGIEPLPVSVASARGPDFGAARTLALARVATPWILVLDADERVAREAIVELRSRPDDPGVSGYFCRWNTHGPGAVVEDYKLCLFRRGLRSRGRVHEGVQPDVRERRLHAEWLDSLRVEHYPDVSRQSAKHRSRVARMREALALEPDWFRYHWFLGYTCRRQGMLVEAARYLRVAADAESARFPVECLNSKLVLADLHARAGERRELARVLHSALDFYRRVQHDFEVRVNFRLLPWLERATQDCARGRLDAIRSYSFVC